MSPLWPIRVDAITGPTPNRSVSDVADALTMRSIRWCDWRSWVSRRRRSSSSSRASSTRNCSTGVVAVTRASSSSTAVALDLPAYPTWDALDQQRVQARRDSAALAADVVVALRQQSQLLAVTDRLHTTQRRVPQGRDRHRGGVVGIVLV